jgi:hypothetical protein
LFWLSSFKWIHHDKRFDGAATCMQQIISIQWYTGKLGYGQVRSPHATTGVPWANRALSGAYTNVYSQLNVLSPGYTMFSINELSTVVDDLPVSTYSCGLDHID